MLMGWHAGKWDVGGSNVMRMGREEVRCRRDLLQDVQLKGSDGEGVILTAAAMTSHPPESQSVFATRHASSVLIYF